MKLKSLLFALGLVLLMSSCATIFTGTKSKVTITSIPPGANIVVDGIDRGVTPSTLSLKRGFESPTISLKLDGYKTRTFEPEQSFQLVSILNLGNPFGWAIDAVSGAAMKYDPKVYELKLEPETAK